MKWLIGALVERTDICCDDVWVVGLTPVECARSRETVHRSGMAGWTEHGAAPNIHAGLGAASAPGLHPGGVPVGYASTGAEADERQTFLHILAGTMHRIQIDGHRQLLNGDQNHYGAEFEDTMDKAGI